MHEALENFFHFDAKLFRDIVTLLFQPGRLSGDFNAGKRAGQMPPFRLYLFISVLFFFIEFLSAGHTKAFIADPEDDPARQAAIREAVKDATKELPPDSKIGQQLQEVAAKAPSSKPPARNYSMRDMVKDANAKHEREQPNDSLGRYLLEKGGQAVDHQEELTHAVLTAIPKMLLVCLPIFALYTRVLFRKAGQNYLQHLIVSVHYHTFVYLWWLVAAGWEGLFGLVAPGLASLASFASGLWLVLYPIAMLHHLYANSWKRTVFKTLLLAGAYALTLAFAFLATAAIVFLLS